MSSRSAPPITTIERGRNISGRRFVFGGESDGVMDFG
jgi:hypothetical protein